MSNGKMLTHLGEIEIDSEVIATYAGSSAVGCFGVVGMAAINMRDGFVKLLHRENLKKGVKVTINDNKLTVCLHIIISYGVRIAVIAENLISDVKYKLEKFVGMEVAKIYIYVEGVRVID